jgi:hypothetical protein
MAFLGMDAWHKILDHPLCKLRFIPPCPFIGRGTNLMLNIVFPVLPVKREYSRVIVSVVI